MEDIDDGIVDSEHFNELIRIRESLEYLTSQTTMRLTKEEQASMEIMLLETNERIDEIQTGQLIIKT